jgi:hypothetical protein
MSKVIKKSLGLSKEDRKALNKIYNADPKLFGKIVKKIAKKNDLEFVKEFQDEPAVSAE